MLHGFFKINVASVTEHFKAIFWFVCDWFTLNVISLGHFFHYSAHSFQNLHTYTHALCY